ncbi:secretory calcium-binding phosphoprotein 1 isoform X2 [Girardinichthys multiradiatus]|uniref:secretory calcium-binding phosphoprotein 1 isoform X2 n=1 Tax=Girardinichthys multiradiatus TaxID=208333 RepID=UPI001FAB957F|nr:secretory calcium-binding phosphoprotein 1 isoform X2 [Girardinichthys multiradiatus]
MKVIIMTFFLIGAAFANPILHNSLVSTESESNSTESLSILESSENNTSELQSSEESTSNQSSESESAESTSEDKTSEESDSQSDENDGMDSMDETKDNSMGSEENVRKNWVKVFASVVKGVSAEDNTSTEVKGHLESLSNELSDKQQTDTKTVQIRTNQPLLEQSTDSSDTSDSGDVTTAASDSSDSTSSESQESQETSDSNDSSAASKSTEDSNASDSAELEQVRAKDCVNSMQSCESEEYFLQSIGDDAHSPGEHMMVPDEDDRELRLRR